MTPGIENHTPADIAIITAGISIISSIILGIYNLKMNKRIEAFKSELDKQKIFNVEYLKNYLNYHIDGKQKELDAFRDILNKIQLFRDKINGLITNPEGYYWRILVLKRNDWGCPLGLTTSYFFNHEKS